ncbi:hypothetical protein [Parageobacillus thermoglucosidasius]|uniref:hypothetical protein n=1 Tax=Parageobacillus thermoglucosidasius TaxID=1426 RepID=UPI000B56F9BF|nr:hypothetical protein [Parageobacillus thermoglucosidasius]MBY6267877.1 hypothetical protein [Parageobacillus thermoglucosidasius]OUM87371.1 MAG: hypothetical protein BAA00_21220 [Parageobacillus thermoglucosidasius]REK55745.1 MAG: hypothetical protein C6P36_11275 [Geobacillus sp.]
MGGKTVPNFFRSDEAGGVYAGIEEGGGCPCSRDIYYYWAKWGILAEGAFWVMQTYISDAERLSFARRRDIADGLEWLQTYHFITAMLASIPMFQTIIPHHSFPAS